MAHLLKRVIVAFFLLSASTFVPAEGPTKIWTNYPKLRETFSRFREMSDGEIESWLSKNFIDQPQMAKFAYTDVPIQSSVRAVVMSPAAEETLSSVAVGLGSKISLIAAPVVAVGFALYDGEKAKKSGGSFGRTALCAFIDGITPETCTIGKKALSGLEQINTFLIKNDSNMQVLLKQSIEPPTRKAGAGW